MSARLIGQDLLFGDEANERVCHITTLAARQMLGIIRRVAEEATGAFDIVMAREIVRDIRARQREVARAKQRIARRAKARAA